ncbi:MAG: hypothetical protein RLO52_17405 [Sandaracinaceae bacterium]
MDDSEYSPRSGTTERKRPYERPRVQETAQFETLALACAKLPGGPASCVFGGTTNS